MRAAIVALGHDADQLDVQITQLVKLLKNGEEVKISGFGKFAVRDVWAKKDLGTTRENRTDHVESHDVVLFRLTPVK